MSVMCVGDVRVRVREHGMVVWMRVPAPARRWRGRVMIVPVVCIVVMPMRVIHRLMGVSVSMPFAEMEPDTDGHQSADEQQH